MEWISVKERLPYMSSADENGKVLVWREMNESQKAMSKSIYDWHMVRFLDDSAYWMPLPPPPKK